MKKTYHPITSNPPTHQLGPWDPNLSPPRWLDVCSVVGEPKIKMLAFWIHLYLAIASEHFFWKKNWFLKNLHVDVWHPVHQDGKTHWSYFMGDFAVEIIYKHGMPTGTNWISCSSTDRVRLGLPKAFVIEGDFEKKRRWEPLKNSWNRNEKPWKLWTMMLLS